MDCYRNGQLRDIEFLLPTVCRFLEQVKGPMHATLVVNFMYAQYRWPLIKCHSLYYACLVYVVVTPG
jgi:hypothetical protein